MKRVAITLALLATLPLAFSLVAGERLTRPARQVIGPPPPGLHAEAVQIRDAHGRLVAGWFAPGRPGEGAVLLLHGVRGNRLQMLARARWLQREGIAALLIDLPAHGDSEGERITFGRRESLGAQTALQWLRARAPGEKVGAIGVSLGGAALLFADRRPELDALVLESVYPTITDAVQDRLAMRLGRAGVWVAPLLLMQIPLRLEFGVQELRPIAAMPGVRAPLLVAAGTEDRHTRWPETERMFAAALAPKTLWPVKGAAHVDLHAFDAAAYEARLLPWLQSHLSKAPG